MRVKEVLMSADTNDAFDLERAIVEVVKVLPTWQAVQVLDYARWLQTQPAGIKLDDEAQRALELEERSWTRAYEAKRAEYRQMAHQALADLANGDTRLMVVDNGKLEAR
jgi:hypothetical protein